MRRLTLALQLIPSDDEAEDCMRGVRLIEGLGFVFMSGDLLLRGASEFGFVLLLPMLLERFLLFLFRLLPFEGLCSLRLVKDIPGDDEGVSEALMPNLCLVTQ